MALSCSVLCDECDSWKFFFFCSFYSSFSFAFGSCIRRVFWYLVVLIIRMSNLFWLVREKRSHQSSFSLSLSISFSFSFLLLPYFSLTRSSHSILLFFYSSVSQLITKLEWNWCNLPLFCNSLILVNRLAIGPNGKWCNLVSFNQRKRRKFNVSLV